MALQLLPAPEDRKPTDNVGSGGGPRILATGAPVSPGAVPPDLAQHLVFGEVLIWWGDKDRIHYGPVLMVLAAVVSILGFVSLLAPEFWLNPPLELAKPLAVLFSPALLVLARERLNQRAVLVTDSCIVDVGPDGRSSRLPFDKIRSVARDVVRGGIRLQSGNTRVLIPPPLTEDARKAIALQMRNRIRHSEIEDPLGWMP